MKMIVKKTGFYSGKGPCQFGAIIGGASKQEIPTLAGDAVKGVYFTAAFSAAARADAAAGRG